MAALTLTALTRMGPMRRSRAFGMFGVTTDHEPLEAAVVLATHLPPYRYTRQHRQLLKSVIDFCKRRLLMGMAVNSLPVKKQRKHKPKFGDDLDLNLLTPAQISNILTSGSPKQVRQILTQFTLMGLQSAGVKHAEAVKYIRLMFDITRDETLQALPTPLTSPSTPPQEDIAGWTSNDS